MIYQAALRAETTARLGVVWGPVDRNGQADIDGVPEELLSRYSKRRVALEADAKVRIAESERILGRSLSPEERRRTYERATLETRGAKAHPDAGDEGLHDRWLADATGAGLGPKHWLGQVLDRRSNRPHLDMDTVVAEALAELARSSSTWGRRHVVQQLARRAPAELAGAEEVRQWVEQCADLVLRDPSVVRLVAPCAEPPVDLRRRDGRSVFEAHGAPRFSTLGTLATEQSVLDVAVAGREANCCVADASATEGAVASHGLGPDQAEAVRRLTLSGEALACMVGPAGAGKSRAMGAAAEAWRQSGMAVRGLAVSASAAGVLATEAGIASETIAKFLYEHDRPNGPGEPWRLSQGEVVVIDEAAMVASADLARVVALAADAQAKVVLVGDHRQLGAVEARGLFRLLAAETNAAELTGVRRFSAEWEGEASLRLRNGDRSVVEEYLSRGRVVGGQRQPMVGEAFVRWELARARGDSVVVCAADHATVDELAARARAARVAAGEVEAGGVLAGEQVVGVGDEIVTCRNDRRLVTSGGAWVRNGDRWKVLARQSDDSLLVEDLSGRGQVVLSGDYVGDDVALAYAVTLHKAQGLTVDQAILLVDERTTAEGLYVGMTRGRNSNVALAVCEEDGIDHRPAGPAPSASEMLVGALGRSATEVAALESLRETLSRSESLATLAPRLANLDAWIAKEMPPDPSRELKWAADGLDHARAYCRPGHVTRSGRGDRRRLQEAEARYDAVAAEGDRRQAWLEAHADTLAYRDELAASVAKRRRELGVAATITRPDHVVDLIGAVPSDNPAALQRWTNMAGRIEAYREEWGVASEQLRERPSDACQARDWGVAVQTSKMLARPPVPVVGRSPDHGIGLEL